MSTKSFPKDNIDPELKKKNSYGIEVSDAIYSNIIKSATGGSDSSVNSSAIKTIQENRLYATNNQSVNMYKPRLNAAIDSKGDSSYMNIDWSISTPCKKFADTIIGDMINQEYKVGFNSISPYSRTKRAEERDKYFAKLVMKQQIYEMEQEVGISLIDKSGFDPKDADDINLYMDMEYRLPIEIGMEEIVDYELYRNDWDKKIKNRVIRDLVENNKGCVRWYFDENNRIRMRYVDIGYYYSSFTTEPDNSNVDYEAEYIFMALRDLRLRDSNNILKDDDWNEIARTVSGKYGNPVFDATDFEFKYDDFRIPVLDFVYYTIDDFYYVEKQKDGKTIFDKKKWGYESNIHSVHVKKKIMSYEGLRIIGTKHLINYGLSENILRHQDPNNHEKRSPDIVKRYVSFQLPGKSIVDVMKPNIDNIQLLVLRKRHIISEINPTGIGIDVDGITNIMSIMKLKDPMDVVRIYKQKGIALFSRTDVNGDPSNGLPIHELGSSFSNLLVSLDQSILSEINIIRENIGVNEARDGSKPDKDALVGIEKLRLLASNNTTRELYRGFTNGILAPTGIVIERMLKYKHLYGDGIQEYEDVISKVGVDMIRFSTEIELTNLGIKIEALPSAEELEDLIGALKLSLQSQEISVEDYMEVKKVLNTKKAIRYLSQKKKKHAEQKMLEFQQKEDITAEREASSAMASAEAQKIKEMAKAEAGAMLEEVKLRLEKELNDHETINKIKIIDRESYWKTILIEKAQENDSKKEVEEGNVKTGGEKVFSDPERAATRNDVVI